MTLQGQARAEKSLYMYLIPALQYLSNRPPQHMYFDG